MAAESRSKELRYVRPPRPIVFPVDETVPESTLHLEIRTALYAILKYAFADRAVIGCDQFVYWDASNPKKCLAPDAFIRLGTPDEHFSSWKTWERGAPHLAVEVLSPSDADTIEQKLPKYHQLGVLELVSFDPETNEFRIWDRVKDDLVERAFERGKPTECPTLSLFWTLVKNEEGDIIPRLARNDTGTDLLPTPEEAALERVRLLEARLAKLEGR